MPVVVSLKPSIEEVQRRFENRANNLGDYSAPYKKASILLDKWVQRNFKDEGAALGPDKWKPFANGGRDTGGGIDTSAKLLQKTGRLRLSFLPFANKKDAGIGSHLNYSKPHEEGAGFLPKRRMLPLHKEVHDEIEDILHKHGLSALRGHAK